MTVIVPIRLAVEDVLSEFILRRALKECGTHYEIGAVYMRGGFGYLKKQTPGFNNAAKACPFLLLTDLDTYGCPPDLLQNWLDHPQHPHFLLRVAVREVEAWLLADDDGLKRYFRLNRSVKYSAPEALPDPKATLLRVALKARPRIVRDALVWQDENSGQLFQGPDYNGTLGEFVMNHWDTAKSRKLCPSFERLFLALTRLQQNIASVAQSVTR